MKKLIATMLAVLMLFGAVALAEDSQALMTLSDVRVQSGNQTLDVQDMLIGLALGNVEDLPSVVLMVDGAGEPLATAVAQLTSEQVNFAVDGMDYGFFAGIPEAQRAQLAEVGDEGLAMLLPALVPELDKFVLPAFQGVDIPKLDMTGLLSGFITADGQDGSEFEIPVETVDSFLDQVLQIARQQGEYVAQLDSLAELIEALQAEGKGVAIRGSISDDGTTQKLVGNVCLVSGAGKQSDVARLTVTTTENKWKLSVAVGKGFLSMDVVTATLISRPSEGRIDFDLDVIGGVSMTMALFSEDGLQQLTFDLEGLGEQARLAFACGRQEGSDILSFSGQVADAAVSLDIRTAMGADGVRTGSLALSAKQGGNVTGLSGELTLYTCDDLDLSGITMPADLRPIDQMDEAGKQALRAAFAPVTDYIAAHTASRGE